uniref:Uncharacterized protein n=1 Tax=viral metagenome TaxID=1070528 RepID=A0A6C0LGW1_9ZZZZ
MISIYRCCGFESNAFERPILQEKMIIEKQSKEDKEEKEKEKPTFYSGDTVSVYNDDIYHRATIIYVEKVMSFLEGECQHMYARFHNPVIYHHFLKKGLRLISIHPKGVFEKCVVVTILYEEDAGEKDKIKEILVKNESTMSSRMVYSINLEKIDSILINEYKIKQV